MVGTKKISAEINYLLDGGVEVTFLDTNPDPEQGLEDWIEALSFASYRVMKYREQNLETVLREVGKRVSKCMRAF